MALGQKIFEGTGNAVAFRITKVHPVEGITIELSYVDDWKRDRQISKWKEHEFWYNDPISPRSRRCKLQWICNIFRRRHILVVGPRKGQDGGGRKNKRIGDDLRLHKFAEIFLAERS